MPQDGGAAKGGASEPDAGSNAHGERTESARASGFEEDGERSEEGGVQEEESKSLDWEVTGAAYFLAHAGRCL
eukprot:3703299-Rhodomonas_salina.1